MATAISRRSSVWVWLIGIAIAIASGLLLLPASPWSILKATSSTSDSEEGHDHDHEEHDHAAESSIAVSPQARGSIGLKTAEIAVREYARVISVPAIVAERPGRTHVTIAAPLTGVVTGQFIARGEAVKSGRLMFRLRLTHEDLVQAQSEFLQTLVDVDVEQREIERLEGAGDAIPGNRLLEKRYQKEKFLIELAAQRESLMLHGLSVDQVATIEKDRKLLRELIVEAPFVHDDASLHDNSESDHAAEGHEVPQQFVVEELAVNTGEAVQAGQMLCVLGDYSELLVEGNAFEQDASDLVRAANEGHHVSAVLEDGRSQSEMIEDLSISFVANQVDPETRALHFYASLPNTIVRDAVEGERHFLTWRFKPGQRMQVRVPVETWPNVIVLPVDAVAQDGIESVVFVENGDQFARRQVQVTYRDQVNAVIANDGALFPGESVALNGAHQLLMAIKNKAGGPVDPHAGHNH